MNSLRSTFGVVLLVAAYAISLSQIEVAAQAASNAQASQAQKTYPADLVKKGNALFQQDCSFCHGHDATGGESGPDLTRSRLVREDVEGNKIGPVIRNGRPDKGMPPFDKSDDEIASLMAFIHTQQNTMRNTKGGRKGVDPEDLRTGNVEAGKKYFNGACASCHSPSGDLAGVATRYEGLRLEMQMLYPRAPKSRVTVTLPSGQTIAGTLAYLDEFTVALTDESGAYRSWRTRDVKYKVDEPVNAHADLLGKYTDDDIHNLMAFLQTLR
jgi:cytochrome c oxidase cbb3-type subunit 3